MNTTKTVIASIVASIVVVLAGFSIYHPSVVIPADSSDTEHAIVRGTSPEIASPYLIVNGVTQWFNNVAFNNASTTGTTVTLKQTLCAIPAPLGTSSLEFVSWDAPIATSTAAFIEIATSTSPFSTTTTLYPAFTLAAGAQGAKRWTPAGQNIDDSIFFSSTSTPTYVDVIATGAATSLGGYTWTNGFCNSIFDQM